MRVLGIDVCTGICAAAVIDGDDVLASLTEPMTRGHVERLAPMVQQVLTAAGITPADLNAIAVTTGPGSFTGARLGVSFARGLGLSLGIPTVGVSVFEAMALPDPCVIALDGKRGSLFVQAFDGAPLAPPAEYAQEAAWHAAPEGDFVVTGSGADLLLAAAPDAVTSRARRVSTPTITPEMVARIGAQRLSQGVPPRPAPLYIRAPDAKPQPAVSFG